MDTIFRIFMFLLPYALCIAAYIWVGGKALHASNIVSKIIALAFVAGGLGYTLYKLFRSISTIATNDLFEFVIIIVMVGVLFFASIAIALGEPEKE
jgi:high-affinity Fe2+/Pb2+ permease